MESPLLLNPSSIINLNLAFKGLTSLDDYKRYKNLVRIFCELLEQWLTASLNSNQIEIDLTGNKLQKTSEISKVLFSFHFLKKINLAFNNLSECLELPPQIESLILNNNKLKKIDDTILTLKSLVTIDLSNNSLQDVTSLIILTKLKHVFLKNNKVNCLQKSDEI